MSSPFVVGETYRRRALHKEHGGSWQNGISTSASKPIIFLFTGEGGEKHGYRDGPQEDGTFWYTGEGQAGDMVLTRGNLAITEAEKGGRTLHLFEQVGKGFVRYVGRADYLGHHAAITPDTSGKDRNSIVFELGIEGGEIDGAAADLRIKEPKSRSDDDLSVLKQRAIQSAPQGAHLRERRVNVRQRSQAVREYVLGRSKGVCEGCEQPAPFMKMDGRPYLEPHHIRRLSDGGPDHYRWVAALCPNCHRRVHHGHDGSDFNKRIGEKLAFEDE